jgi:hypothetical protein
MDAFKTRTARSRIGFTAVVLLAGVAGLVPTASAAPGGTVNTFTVSGKYHGTLTLTNPGADCIINEYSNPHLSDSVNLDPMTGVLSGLKPKIWSFLATEPKQGTFVTKHTNQATSAKLRPGNLNAVIAFSQTSGTITFDGAKGSVNMKMVFDNGVENTVTETVVGNWTCPLVHHI